MSFDNVHQPSCLLQIHFGSWAGYNITCDFLETRSIGYWIRSWSDYDDYTYYLAYQVTIFILDYTFNCSTCLAQKTTVNLFRSECSDEQWMFKRNFISIFYEQNTVREVYRELQRDDTFLAWDTGSSSRWVGDILISFLVK